MQTDTSAGRYGTFGPENQTSDYNQILFTVNQILASRNFAMVVRVVATTSDDSVSPVGYVDVQPMVNQVDAQGVPFPHGVVNNLPYMRMQGGANAIIMDPEVGDIGVAIFADRDISSVKATGDVANPGSMRRSDMADGLYVGGFLNGVPTQFVRFSADGIEITSPTKITLAAPTVEINGADEVTITTGQFTVNGPSQFNGTLDASNTITAPNVEGTSDVTGGGKSLKTHIHTGGTISGKTGTPV